MKKTVAAAMALSISVAAHAQNNYTNSYYEISRLAFYSKDDTIYPNWAGFVQVDFNAAVAWVTSSACNNISVAIRGTDTHLIAAVQTAHATGRPIRLFTDDAYRLDSQFCILRGVQY